MAEKTRQSSVYDTIPDIENQDLRETLNEYLSEENKKTQSIWNFRTFSGLAMIFVAMSVIAQLVIGNTLGITLGPDLNGILNILPYVGGGFLVLLGLGFIRSSRRKRKESKKLNQLETSASSTASSLYSSSANDSKDRLDDFLYPERNREKGRTVDAFDNYALQQPKKLFKSRSDKKIAGVCGGLAKYFGTSSTMVRLTFVLAALLGYGSFILVYLAMSIIIPKEPPF